MLRRLELLAPELGSLRRRQQAARVVVDDDATPLAMSVLEVAFHGERQTVGWTALWCGQRDPAWYGQAAVS